MCGAKDRECKKRTLCFLVDQNLISLLQPTMEPNVSYQRNHRMLWRIRQQWKLLGFFEINEKHEFFVLACRLKQGLKASIQITIDDPVGKESLNPSDFTRVLKQIHEGYEMRTYAAPVFARFRQYLGMSDTDFQRSLSCESSYLQFISNSKSSADFFLTFDKRYFLKSQRKREIRFLLTNLPKYLDHMERYPHSILVKFLGIYSIIAPQEKKRYFIIMQSIFYPHEKITERYDIKGCQVGRWTDPTPDGSEIIVVFKDCNFEDKVICLDQDQTWLVQQVKLDTQFLKALDVIDYSFLMGLQPLHDDERLLNKTLADILARTRLSINYDYRHRSIASGTFDRGGPSSSSFTTMPSSEQMQVLSPDLLSPYPKPSMDRSPEQLFRSEGFMREVLRPYLMQNSYDDMSCILGDVVHSSSLSISSSELFVTQHRRILPASKNPLHTFDGPDYRYFVGIVDLFTVYNFRKKLEHLWKSIRYRGQQFSTVEPSYYAQRFCQWVEDHTK
ncbi:phosphatidylinositol 4-phosphate 5-kinase-like protein 1 [Python bivittatus]|uniref:Phosphatidylinositol 4-phosphate 5-kinase-like protein 1 n=1 Tax=Python bivittatus TaxID=176946 RepID=A0A9F2R2T4_PYTBI|nr:phosphatidylinositol 4-phosphate 5-kinase-like protein 1 [Python bivittatus]XP_025026445.1 phosphatidylinositol 4-phosphate 5-kinase-like protein 1 [Python bivittatus]